MAVARMPEVDPYLVLVESLVRGVSAVQLVFGLSNLRQSANFPLVKPKIRARVGQNVCPIRGEFAAGERFHQGQKFRRSAARDCEISEGEELAPGVPQAPRRRDATAAELLRRALVAHEARVPRRAHITVFELFANS